MTDLDYMRRALRLAERGRGRTTPNPMVGAVIVTGDGIIVGSGYHERAGEPHAEIHALRAAGEQARGATLYCTLEPCSHVGRTGPCVESIVAAGMTRVVASLEDPDPRVRGSGFGYLRRHGVRVEVGVGRVESAVLNAPFLTATRHGRPFVTMKVALSLDGCIAAAPGERTQLTSPQAVRRAQLLRAEADAIGVGSGTVLVDDPLLTVREVFRERPLVRVIFDSRLRTPPTARLFSTLSAGPVIVMTTEGMAAASPHAVDMLVRAGATVEVLPRRELAAALRRLHDLGITSLVLEGGAQIHAAAWRDGLVDRVQAFITPVRIGDSGLKWRIDSSAVLGMLHAVRVEPCGPDAVIEGYVHRID
ncbi:MAG: bifunctional diaminohydroxyphosphoribosylaminopyrimidine deaminase/5-amino-6-(5-phosphoribosylamino)uracil reductase RibD [Acidobacteria bacterium]|nr:bifunctional diaminohydroxyphosphoribosylaminopyrimidine deaminase/5-amino-6-(5-phosphoribosylamino)uracil reductase RibD [Acidobacteriota bacterium]